MQWIIRMIDEQVRLSIVRSPSTNISYFFLVFIACLSNHISPDLCVILTVVLIMYIVPILPQLPTHNKITKWVGAF